MFSSIEFSLGEQKNKVKQETFPPSLIPQIPDHLLDEMVYSFLQDNDLDSFKRCVDIFNLQAHDPRFCYFTKKNTQEVEIYNFLHHAIYTQNMALFYFLLERAKKDGYLNEAIHSFGYDNGTRLGPLHLAAHLGHLKMVQTLVEYGADLLFTEQQFFDDFYGITKDENFWDEPKNDLVIFRGQQTPHYTSSYDDYTFLPDEIERLNALNLYALGGHPIDEAIEANHTKIVLFLLNSMTFTSEADKITFLEKRLAHCPPSNDMSNRLMTELEKSKFSLSTACLSQVHLLHASVPVCTSESNRHLSLVPTL